MIQGKHLTWRVILMAIVFTGCTRFCEKGQEELSPEEVVEAYLNVSLNMTEVGQRTDLLQYTTGDLKAAIANAPDSLVKEAYVDRQYKIRSYSVVERKDKTPREVEITFQLTFDDYGYDKDKSKEAPTVTTENTVSVIKENNLWLIRTVLGAQTSIDFPVSLESRINAKPGEITPLSNDEDQNPDQ